MYIRTLQNTLIDKIGKGKAILLVGPRQTGKTTLIHTILKDKNHLFMDCDDPTTRRLLTSPNTEDIRGIIGG
ncbi:MAG: AAA family ATPase, partial [Fidelibacterota bacterium]